MRAADQDNLALWSQYGDLYNEIVRPERKYTVSHYLRTRWAPLLGPARLWFVTALRQRCFWNQKQDWCVVDKKTLARESGLSLRTVNRIIAAVDRPTPGTDRDEWAGWFFGKTRRRRYNQQVGRTVNAPNRYHVLLDDPLAPDDQAALAHHLRQEVAGNSPEDTLHVLQGLCECSDRRLTESLSSPSPQEEDPAEVLPAAFAFDVVQANCPMPHSESALYAAIARAASRLHNVITRPERVHMGNQYFRLQWLPRLGPMLSSLIVNLRARCYWNERTGELRDTCRASWAELAREIGCTTRQLRNVRRNPDLYRFFALRAEGHGHARSQFKVSMADPLTDPDRQRFETQIGAQIDVLTDPETGQLDTWPLLFKGEILALGKGQEEILAPRDAPQAEVLAQRERETLTLQPEVLALGERKIWHIEGLKAEVLAPQPGNSGTTKKILLITPTPKGLTETTLPLTPAATDNGQLLAAAILKGLLAGLNIQEPNRGRLVARHPQCNWVVAWGLYALTQPGLSENKAGYVYNRLWARDPPPSDLLELAMLPPSAWRAFHRASKRGHRAAIPEPLRASFALWKALLGPLWDALDVRLDIPEEDLQAYDLAQEPLGDAGPDLPAGIVDLLLGDERIAYDDARCVLSTPDLYHAYCLARAATGQRARGLPIEVQFTDCRGQEHALNAEILALGVEPLSIEVWDAARQELSWQMTRGVFERWWRRVHLLGITVPSAAEMPCVVLGAPSEDVAAWIAARQMPIVVRTWSGVIGQPVQVRFVVYATLTVAALP